MELITMKQGSTPTLPIKKANTVTEYTSVIFTFIDVAGNKLIKPNPIEDDTKTMFEITFNQTELKSLVSGTITVEGQYIIGQISGMTDTSSFELLSSKGGYEIVDGSGGLVDGIMELELVNPFVKTGDIILIGVQKVNGKSPDADGNVALTANDILFNDGESLQQKFDNGTILPPQP